jgi:hypothetical protein
MWPFKKKQPELITTKHKVGKIVVQIFERGESPRNFTRTFIGTVNGLMHSDYVECYSTWLDITSALDYLNEWLSEDVKFIFVNDKETIALNIADIKEIVIFENDEDYEIEYTSYQ